MTDNSSIESKLHEILTAVKSIKQDHDELAGAVDKIHGRVNALSLTQQLGNGTQAHANTKPTEPLQPITPPVRYATPVMATSQSPPRANLPRLTSKIILTSYPGQAGVDPLPMKWGAEPAVRGPVVVARTANTIGRRNGRIHIEINSDQLTDTHQQSVHTVVPTRSTMPSLLPARTLISHTSQTIPMRNPPSVLAPSQRGQTQRRSWQWIRTATWLLGYSRIL